MFALSKKSSPSKACLMKTAITLLAFTLLIFSTGLSVTQYAFAETYGTEIDAVSDDEFAPAGYSWSLNFSSVVPESGWTYTDDLAQYYRVDGIGTADNPNLVNVGDDGYMIAIDSSTQPSGQTLRFQGGSYRGEAVDALVSVVDWTYLEPLDGNGWENWRENSHSPEPGEETIENFTPGIFYNPSWDQDGIRTGDIRNFNFYTVGLCDLEIEVTFCEAGTSIPIDVSGHITCVDLDVNQGFAFGGAINLAQVSRESLESGHLTIDYVDNQIMAGPLAIGDALVDPNYKLGLVGCYFDYTTSSDPISLKFITSYSGEGTAISFFAMINEYLTSDNPNDEDGYDTTETIKTADKTQDLVPGDTVTFTVDAQVHERGVNCRSDWCYDSFEIIDTLPIEMSYIEDSGYLTDESGEILSNAGYVLYDETTNSVTFTFDENFLKESMAMTGEHYLFVFQAKIESYPSDGSYLITNNAYSCFNDIGIAPAEPLDLYLIEAAEPSLSIEKSVEESTVPVGSNANYTVTVTNIGSGSASNVVINDTLPQDLTYVENSISTDTPDAQISTEDNTITVLIPELGESETCTIAYQATVNDYTDPTIINTAGASADNANEVFDTAEINPDDSQTNMLPAAGGTGRLIFFITGGVLIAAAAIAIIGHRKNEKKRYLAKL